MPLSNKCRSLSPAHSISLQLLMQSLADHTARNLWRDAVAYIRVSYWGQEITTHTLKHACLIYSRGSSVHSLDTPCNLRSYFCRVARMVIPPLLVPQVPDSVAAVHWLLERAGH